MRVLPGLLLVLMLTIGARADSGSGPSRWRVLIVQADEANDGHLAMVHRFADAFAQKLQASGLAVPAFEDAPARTAAKEMKAGRCDAVIVLGPDRPWSLRRLNKLTFAGSLGIESFFEPVSLIIGNERPDLQDRLARAFAGALESKSAAPSLVAAR